ncbi:hypothetical protein PG993_013686 [Apiospora rasikravindrae]|uniref:Uncharacterized protein n=1 Tax=Apiospora rasikravindrae TaxID=990691 RepID=A0ABR1RSF2_9PEZI
MVSLEDIKAMKIPNWDAGCKVSLYAGSRLCSGRLVYEKYKEVAEMGRLVDNDWTCVIDLNGKGITSAEYNCSD